MNVLFITKHNYMKRFMKPINIGFVLDADLKFFWLYSFRTWKKRNWRWKRRKRRRPNHALIESDIPWAAPLDSISLSSLPSNTKKRRREHTRCRQRENNSLPPSLFHSLCQQSTGRVIDWIRIHRPMLCVLGLLKVLVKDLYLLALLTEFTLKLWRGKLFSSDGRLYFQLNVLKY